ncbi:uncharacterized protein DDB_G0288805-like [Stomoxys calcitrans]|uniref:uncharacterized protein DDB_G0288805-like n=1 Tax=Stomoxys calcitrans TaxID=35570 RepID=UPI0027E26730|nr:uncharacterized protein DDB_G0288805-like [Stomoxys calcitrans]
MNKACHLSLIMRQSVGSNQLMGMTFTLHLQFFCRNVLEFKEQGKATTTTQVHFSENISGGRNHIQSNGKNNNNNNNNNTNKNNDSSNHARKYVFNACGKDNDDNDKSTILKIFLKVINLLPTFPKKRKSEQQQQQ